ncbi:hypothetical protein HK405_009818, partial [Cladochytrium tenue]
VVRACNHSRESSPSVHSLSHSHNGPAGQPPAVAATSMPALVAMEEDAPQDAVAVEPAVFRLLHWDSFTILSFCSVKCPDLRSKRMRAISHVWGDDVVGTRIGEIPWTVPIAPSKHIEDAVEGSPADTYFWMDILCIDQDSPAELMQATQIMTHVFSMCEGACLWLARGPQPVVRNAHLVEGGTVPAWPLLGTARATHDVLVRMMADENDRSGPGGSTLEELHDMMAAATAAPWFERVWTTQELLLSRHIYFGGAQLDLAAMLTWFEDLVLRFSEWPLDKITMPCDIEELKATIERRLKGECCLWWPLADWVWRSNIESFRQSVEVYERSLQHRLTLADCWELVCLRKCKYQRDMALCLPPILGVEVKFSAFALEDYSPRTAAKLWKFLVLQMWHRGERSLIEGSNVICPIAGPEEEWEEMERLDDLGGMWIPRIAVGSWMEYPQLLNTELFQPFAYHIELVAKTPPTNLEHLDASAVITNATVGQVIVSWSETDRGPSNDAMLALSLAKVLVKRARGARSKEVKKALLDNKDTSASNKTTDDNQNAGGEHEKDIEAEVDKLANDIYTKFVPLRSRYDTGGWRRGILYLGGHPWPFWAIGRVKMSINSYEYNGPAHVLVPVGEPTTTWNAGEKMWKLWVVEGVKDVRGRDGWRVIGCAYVDLGVVWNALGPQKPATVLLP